jgi:hypothetical protein
MRLAFCLRLPIYPAFVRVRSILAFRRAGPSGLLLVGTDGNPDVIHDHEGAEDNHSGDQASDGLVGHDIPSVPPRTTTGRAYLGTVN